MIFGQTTSDNFFVFLCIRLVGFAYYGAIITERKLSRGRKNNFKQKTSDVICNPRVLSSPTCFHTVDNVKKKNTRTRRFRTDGTRIPFKGGTIRVTVFYAVSLAGNKRTPTEPAEAREHPTIFEEFIVSRQLPANAFSPESLRLIRLHAGMGVPNSNGGSSDEVKSYFETNSEVIEPTSVLRACNFAYTYVLVSLIYEIVNGCCGHRRSSESLGLLSLIRATCIVRYVS